MPGIKRQRAGGDVEAKSNGVKKAKKETKDVSKADKKLAHKLARRETGALEGKSKVKGAKKEGTAKEKTSLKTTKGFKKGEEQASDALEESDTTEDENGFYGFSANDAAAGAAEAEEDEVFGDAGEGEEEIQKLKMPKKDLGKLPKATSKLNGSTDGSNVTNSREAHQKQKQLARERKALKPNADEIQRAKKLWERLRIKSAVPKDERQKLVAELFELVSGRVQDFVFRHDAVRPIQCAVKYGTMEQKRAIAMELKGSYKQLMEGKYSRFLIGKLLENGDEAVRDTIIPEFYGSVKRLINHPEASWMLDDIYRVKASKVQKAIMLREWYGPEFSIFKGEDKDQDASSADLSAILEASPEKRKPIMDFLRQLVNQLIQKKLTGFTMLHDALLQYFQQLEVGSSDFNDCMRLIIGDKSEEEEDLLKNLAFTKSGADLVSRVLAYGSAKDRKLILRSYKGAIELVARDQHGWKVLVTAYEVVDDTREIQQKIFAELLGAGASEEQRAAQQEKILGLSSEPHGRICLLHPFAGAAKWLLPKPEQADFVTEMLLLRDRAGTSKKNPDTRRREIVEPLAETYVRTVAENAAVLSREPNGCQFISAVLLGATPAAAEKAAAAAANVAALAAGDPSADEHVARSSSAARMLKALIAGGNFDPKQKKVVVTAPELRFADALWEQIGGVVLEWATGDSSFVVVALMEAERFEGKSELRKALTAGRKRLLSAAEGDGKSAKDGPGKGNAGARILLRLLEA